MRTIPRRVFWVILAIGFLLVATAVWQHFRKPDFKKDVAASVAIDSAKKVQDTTSARITKESARVDTVVRWLRVKEAAHVDYSAALRVVADTSGQNARTIQDSSAMWHLRFDFRGLALTHADTALKSADSTIHILTIDRDSLKVDRGRWKVIADSAVASQDRLRRDLAVKGHCTLLPFIPCPSRKVALIAGALGGWLVASGNGAKLLKGIHLQTGHAP